MHRITFKKRKRQNIVIQHVRCVPWSPVPSFQFLLHKVFTFLNKKICICFGKWLGKHFHLFDWIILKGSWDIFILLHPFTHEHENWQKIEMIIFSLSNNFILHSLDSANSLFNRACSICCANPFSGQPYHIKTIPSLPI